MQFKRPMLACSTIPNIEDLNYPVIASPKLDGIRCVMINGVAYSRNLKPIPNKFIQHKLRLLHGLDGELLVQGDFNNVQSAVMSEHGEPNFSYHVFDKWDAVGNFGMRLEQLRVTKDLGPRVKIVEQRRVATPERMHMLYVAWLDKGYEGAIVRDSNSPYKQGRSTMKQGWMLKLKDFKEDEATIKGIQELERNENAAFTGELGQTTRSHEKMGMVPGDTMGALLVNWKGKDFKIGTGFTSEQRQDLWDRQEEIIGKEVTFKYQELSKYGIPRFPVFKQLREDK